MCLIFNVLETLITLRDLLFFDALGYLVCLIIYNRLDLV